MSFDWASKPERRVPRWLWIVAGLIVAMVVGAVGRGLFARSSTPVAAPAPATSPATAPVGAGGLIEPAPASTDGGHTGTAGIRVGFDQSCRGAVQAATSYDTSALKLLGGNAADSKAIAEKIFAPTDDPMRKLLLDFADDPQAPVSRADLAAYAAYAKDPWMIYPSWGGFRVTKCTPGRVAAVDVWSCLYKTDPVHDPNNPAGRSCRTSTYQLTWSGDWKLISANPLQMDAATAATTNEFESPDRTPLTTAQRATVIGIVPGWQEYANAPR